MGGGGLFFLGLWDAPSAGGRVFGYLFGVGRVGGFWVWDVG